DDEEEWPTVANKAQSVQYDSLGKTIFQQEKTQGDLRRRSKQAILHVTFTEIRITELEKQLRALKAKVEDRPDDLKLNEKNLKFPVYKKDLKRSPYGEFQLTTLSSDVPDRQRPSLEVLVSEDIVQPGPSDKQVASSGELFIAPTRQSPERLRLRSLPLIAHLEKICRESLSNPRVWEWKQGKGAPVILLRPFKLLIGYEKEIRASIKSVENMESITDEPEDKKLKKKRIGKLRGCEFAYDDLLHELKLLIEFMDTDLKPTFDLCKAIRDGNAIEIEYADLWHLFRPGDIVVNRSKKEQAFRVVSITGGRSPLVHRMRYEEEKIHPVDGFVVDCCSLCFNGTEYVPKLKKFSIRSFSGRRPITSLEVYPMRFEESAEKVRRRFLAQGRKYLDLTRLPFSHRVCRGNTLDQPSQEIDTQVIVDMALAISVDSSRKIAKSITEEDFTKNDPRETRLPTFCDHQNPEEGCCGGDVGFKDMNMNRLRFNPFRQQNYDGLLGPRRAEELKEEDLILLPNWVYAYVLRSRQWATVKMDDLSEVQFENNLDELMLSPSHKQTILALVDSRESARVAGTTGTGSQPIGAALDLVKGKGVGLIILLHGEPGVGKTSTAECIADKTKRPLFPITCGDIGETATEVEVNLHRNFRMAQKWGCVLLLDEADVFLAKRNKTDLRRNAVTSVFLRSLEYYAGILFLTTNRVGGIDPAFKSRIHLSLYFPRLDLDTTIRLYQVFLRRVRVEQQKDGTANFKVKEREILRFAKHHYRRLQKEGYNTWNGRQIRNAFQTAIALVEHEAAQRGSGQPVPVLGKSQFDLVARGSKEFDSYLIKTLQGGDDEIAMRDQWRHDHFDASAQAVSSSRTASGRPLRDDFESEIESESEETEEETDTEDEDGDCGDMESEPNVGTPAERKPEAEPRAESSSNANQFEEFLKFKAMLKEQ
ncbi:hypothetical protein GQ53DRAFT_628393, partial [Thozetella sp. PMI_491]